MPKGSPRSLPAVGTTSVELVDRDVDVPPATLADFDVVNVLASNGGISSCLARRLGDFGFNKRVLLKVADNTFDASPETNMRLNEEARIGMRLAHPNLLQILDLGRDDGRTFLVREWVDGLGLRAPWAPRGVSHRVLTPSNILLSRSGEVRLGNLSLADPSDRFDSEFRPVEGGYPAFCAPEVLQGARPGHPADIFSLGAVLFETLIGPDAFSGPVHSDWLRYRTDLHIQDRVQASDLPGPLREMLARALHPSPDQRPMARHLREFLRRWLESEHATNGEDALRDALS